MKILFALLLALLPLKVIAQDGNDGSSWSQQSRRDKLTNTEQLSLTRRVRTAHSRYEIEVICLRQKEAVIKITTFDTQGQPKRIQPSRVTGGAWVKDLRARTDAGEVQNVLAVLQDYSNQIGIALRNDNDRLSGLVVGHTFSMREFFTSKQVFVGDIFPDDVLEIPTGFGEDVIEYCTPPRTGTPTQPTPPRAEPRREQPPATQAGLRRMTQACRTTWQGSEAVCQCVLRAVQSVLQDGDYDDAIEVMTLVFTNKGDDVRQKIPQMVRQGGQERAQRIVGALQAIGRDCKNVQ